jgi:hypothetical protein
MGIAVNHWQPPILQTIILFCAIIVIDVLLNITRLIVANVLVTESDILMSKLSRQEYKGSNYVKTAISLVNIIIFSGFSK